MNIMKQDLEGATIVFHTGHVIRSSKITLDPRDIWVLDYSGEELESVLRSADWFEITLSNR